MTGLAAQRLRRVMEAFRAVAKQHQAAYGRRARAAVRSTRAVRCSRSALLRLSSRVPASPAVGLRRAKNSQFHPVFSPRLTASLPASRRRGRARVAGRVRDRGVRRRPHGVERPGRWLPAWLSERAVPGAVRVDRPSTGRGRGGHRCRRRAVATPGPGTGGAAMGMRQFHGPRVSEGRTASPGQDRNGSEVSALRRSPCA